MATDLIFEKKNGRCEASFVMGGSYCSVQVNRDQEGALYYIIRDGNRNVPVKIPFSVGNKDVLVPLKYPDGTIITIISTVPVEYGAVIGLAELINLDVPDVDPSQTYYPNAVNDYDGNWYDAIIYDDQVWLVENLRSEHYSDGTSIELGLVIDRDTPYRYYPNGTQSNVRDYGYLYNGKAMMRDSSPSSDNPSGVQGISPEGWHIPSKAEYDKLLSYIGSIPEYRVGNYTDRVSKAMASKTGWTVISYDIPAPGYNQESNNLSGFNAYPAGACNNFGNNVHYLGFGTTAKMWNTDLVNGMYFGLFDIENNSMSPRDSYDAKEDGYPVRCVCDMAPSQFASWYVNKYKTTNHQVNNKYGSN